MMHSIGTIFKTYNDTSGPLDVSISFEFGEEATFLVLARDPANKKIVDLTSALTIDGVRADRAATGTLRLLIGRPTDYDRIDLFAFFQSTGAHLWLLSCTRAESGGIARGKPIGPSAPGVRLRSAT